MVDTNRFKWHNGATTDPVWWLGIVELFVYFSAVVGFLIALLNYGLLAQKRSQNKAATRQEAWAARIQDILVSLRMWALASVGIFLVIAFLPVIAIVCVVVIVWYTMRHCCSVETVEDNNGQQNPQCV